MFAHNAKDISEEIHLSSPLKEPDTKQPDLIKPENPTQTEELKNNNNNDNTNKKRVRDDDDNLENPTPTEEPKNQKNENQKNQKNEKNNNNSNNNNDKKRVRDDDDDLKQHSKRAKQKNVEYKTFKDIDNFLQEKSKKHKELIDTITKKYYINFLQDTIDSLPMCKSILKDMNFSDDKDNEETFFKYFCIAKTFINVNFQIQKTTSINAIFSTMSSIIGQTVHKNVVEPLFKDSLSTKDINEAFLEYQKIVDQEEEPDRLQCIAYLIQSEIEEQEPLKIPHPIKNCAAKQFKAISKYVTVILNKVAQSYLKNNMMTFTSDVLPEQQQKEQQQIEQQQKKKEQKEREERKERERKEMEEMEEIIDFNKIIKLSPF